MVISILKWLAVAMLLSLAALWLWEGGYWKIANYASVIPPVSLASIGSSSLDSYQLPGQPQFFTVPDTTSNADEMEYGGADYQNPQDALYSDAGSQRQHSPYAGVVTLERGDPQNPNPSSEYVVLQASDYANAPVTVSGWTLKSLYTGNTITVPLAASPFVQGVVNRVGPITLSAGGSVVFVSGTSPVGVSFRESSCTGYLAGLQQFTPQLQNACIRPTDLLPYTPQNAQRYGSSCLDYVSSLPPCTFPQYVPDGLSASCQAYLGATFSYNGCMNAYGANPSTMLNSWRAYGSSGAQLWQDDHDTIVLSDAQGRPVSTLSY